MKFEIQVWVIGTGKNLDLVLIAAQCKFHNIAHTTAWQLVLLSDIDSL